MHRDGIFARHAGVEVDTARHAGEVGVAVNARYAASVVVDNHLCEVDIGDGHERHVEFFHPHVALGVEREAFEVSVYLLCLTVCAEQALGLVERTGIARRLVACGVEGLAGVGRDVVEGGLLVEADALDAVGGGDVVPGEDVPEAPVERGRIGVAVDGVGQHAGVRSISHVAREVAAYLERRGTDITNLAEEALVGVVPTVQPLVAPVVRAFNAHVVVPEHVEFELHNGQFGHHVRLVLVVEVELGLSFTSRQSEAED